MKFEFSRQCFEKDANSKFHENPSSETRVQCGQKDGRTDGWTEGETGTMKLVVTFCDFANAPQKLAWPETCE